MTRIINIPTAIPSVDPMAAADLSDVENPFEQYDDQPGFKAARRKLVRLMLAWAYDPAPERLAALVNAIKKDNHGASDTASREALAYWAGRLGGKFLDERLWEAM